MRKPEIGESYRHFKGHYYKVIGFAKCSETQKELVIYQEQNANGQVWVRPIDMFVDVHPEHNVKRFSLVEQ